MKVNPEIEFSDPVNLIRSINPQMPPKQAIQQIKVFNELGFNETKIPVEEARRELLKEHGYNPDDWTFYSNALLIDGESDDEMMEMLTRNFPPEVEFLVIQGEFVGGVTVGSSSFGIVRYKYHPNGFTAFVRVKPKQLKG